MGEEVGQCRKEKDQTRRLRRLTRLAPTGDPRVAVALFDLMDERPHQIRSGTLPMIYWSATTTRPRRRSRCRADCSPLDIEPFHGYANPDFTTNDDPFTRWKRAEKNLRRRAAQLPQ